MTTTLKIEQEWKPKNNPWIATIPIVLAAFMYALEGTIANVALPHMAGSFSATRDESMWILTSYLIAGGIAIPMVDWFSKLFGRKNFFMISILVFTIASLLCGMATNMGMMIFSRILQGFGGGSIIPLSQAILLESFPKEQRTRAMSLFGLGVIIAPIAGPVLGGWITDNWSWPWIFFINVPVGCFAILMANKLLEDPPYARRQKNVKVDGKGFFFLVGWLVSLQIVLDKGNNADWFNADWIRNLFIVSVIFGIFFFYSQFKNKDSLVDLSVFKDKNFTSGTIIQVIMQAVLYASLAILPQFLQGMMGYTAFLSGISMMPRGLGSLTAIILCGIIGNRVKGKILVALGLLCLGSASLTFGFLNLQISSINIMIPNYFMGMGMGLAMIPIIALSVETLKNEQMTNASGLQNLLKNIGAAIGTSLVATMLTRYAQVHQHMMVGKLSELNPVFVTKAQALAGSFSQLTEASVAQYMAYTTLYKQLLQQASLWAFMDAFRVFGLLCFAVIPLLLLIKAGKKPSSDDGSSAAMMH